MEYPNVCALCEEGGFKPAGTCGLSANFARQLYSCTLHARSSSEGEKRQAFTAVVPTSSTAIQRLTASCACICVPPISYAFPSLPNTRI